MKNRAYLSLIDRARDLGCQVKNGSKHAKIFSPQGKLLQVLSINSSKDLYDINGQIRRLERLIAAETGLKP